MSIGNGDRPVRNRELAAELKSMRFEFRLWLVIAIVAREILPMHEAAQAALNTVGL